MGRKLRTISKKKWLRFAASNKVAKSLSETSDAAFKPMYELLRPTIGRNVDWAELLTAIHVVYAWMPTMLWKNGNPLTSTKNNKKWKQHQVDVFNKVLSGGKNDRPDVDDIRCLLELTNNSTVGLSKLLFIFDPRNFPVWDSRVARNYLIPRRSRLAVGGNVSWYLDWINDSRNWTRDADVRARIRELKKKHHSLMAVSDLRVVELVLFHA